VAGADGFRDKSLVSAGDRFEYCAADHHSGTASDYLVSLRAT